MVSRLCDPIKADFKYTGNIQLMLQVMFQHSIVKSLLKTFNKITQTLAKNCWGKIDKTRYQVLQDSTIKSDIKTQKTQIKSVFFNSLLKTCLANQQFGNLVGKLFHTRDPGGFYQKTIN